MGINRSNGSHFDFFVAYNHEDVREVKRICEEMKARGLKSWLDAEQVPPGRFFQDEIQQVIPKTRCATVFVGPSGPGKWQVLELRVIVSLCVNSRIPVIPVLLPGASDIPTNLAFLRELSSVQFREDVTERDALDQLEWGITGERPVRIGG